jgi:hypothetical protein
MRTNRPQVKRVLSAEYAAVAEVALLLALIVCPSLLIPFAANPFEPHKAAFLWTAAVISVVALIVGSGVHLRKSMVERSAPRWLVITVLCLSLSVVVSVWISESPGLAWWGSGLRRYGGLTELALAGVLVAAVILARDRDRFDRCLVAIVLGSIGPTVYALSQWGGADPLGPGAAAWQRPGSTFGNPLFVSGYLVTVLPVTVACAARAAPPLRTIGAWGLVVLQGVALIAARSIGPALALGAATVIVGTAMLGGLGYRRSAAAIGIVLACSTAVIGVVAPPWLRTRAAAVDAAASVTQTGNQGTLLVRAILWQAAGAGIQREPHILAFGSGPESTKQVLTKYSGSALRAIEGPNVTPDRAHNETLETWVTFGVIGFAFRLAVLYAALGAALAAFGLLPPARYWQFAVLAALVSVALPAITAWRGGVWTLAISVPASMAIVAWLWVVRSSRFSATPNRDVIVPVAATTIAWLTHYFEVQVGLPSIGSAIVGSVAVALTVAGARDVTESLHGSTADRVRAVGSDDALSILGGWAAAAMLISLAGAAAAITLASWTIGALTWGIANLIVGMRRRGLIISAVTAAGVALVWLAFPTAATSPIGQADALATRMTGFYAIAAMLLVAVTWCLSRTLIAPPESVAGPPDQPPPRLRRSEASAKAEGGRHARRSRDIRSMVGRASPPQGTRRITPASNVQDVGSVRLQPDPRGDRLPAYAEGSGEARRSALRARRRQPELGVTAFALRAVPVVLVSVLAARAAVAVSTADVRLGVARSCEQQRDLSCAVSLYTASRGDRSDTRPSIRLAALLAGEAETAGVERRDQLFRQAAAALTLAWSDDPFDYDHARNRGALERRWARRLPPGDRAPHLAEADRWYASAAGLAPAAPLLWEEWANLALERRRPDEALPRLERALALGLKTNEASTLADAWLRTTGIAADERQGFAEAVEEFRRRGYPKLAGLYAARAAASPRSR